MDEPVRADAPCEALTARTLPFAGIDRAEVLRYLGYEGQGVPRELAERIERYVAACEQEQRPRCVWRVLALERADGGASTAATGGRGVLFAGGVLELPGKAIARHLEGADRAALMACTLGAASARRLQALGAVDPLGQLVYDAACTALVEQAADACGAQIEAWARARGLRSGARFSPGYADLPLSVQSPFLDILDAPRALGLTVTSGNLLAPAKSVTAFVGVYGAAGRGAAGVARGCAVCNLHDSCPYRVRGAVCEHAHA